MYTLHVVRSVTIEMKGLKRYDVTIVKHKKVNERTPKALLRRSNEMKLILSF